MDQKIEAALTPDQRPSLGEVVSAAETLAGARRLLKGTGWARVVQRRGEKRVEVNPYVIPRERALLCEDVEAKIHHAAEVLTRAINGSLPFVELDIPNDRLGLTLTITFNE